MSSEPSNQQASRRALLRTAAWTVPAVAVVASAPLASASGVVPPPPFIDFGNACGNTGAATKGCSTSKTLQVPLTLTNNTGADVVFQITGMFVCNNCGSAPTGTSGGATAGISQIWSTPDFASPHNRCSNPVFSNCPGGLQFGSIVVPNGTTNKDYWIESAALGASSNFQATITWRMLDAATCAVLSQGAAQTAHAISPANC